MMRVVPLSSCSTIWVLRAMRAEKSVGKASASSSALVCSDCVPPCVAAIASMQVRTTLLNTSCAASDQPARRPQLRHLHEEVHADAEKERQARCEAVDGEIGREPSAHIFDAVGQR